MVSIDKGREDLVEGDEWESVQSRCIRRERRFLAAC
jgi:hypothetical protein